MEYASSILDLVGDTPMVRLDRVTRELGPADRRPLILGKLEMLNPGGSVKDRIGLPMIEAAERAGLLRPGGTIIEPTSGNTGHGLAIAAAIKGYRCIFVMADKQSAEKQALLRAYGAEVVRCPTNVAPESPESYYSVARRLARDIPGAFQPDQYHNMENPLAHERTTGPEIWEQTAGTITHLVVSVGTGGTVSGCAHYLKAQRPELQVIGADPEGSVLSGDTARPYLTEGIGEDFFPGTYDPDVVDRWERVSDAEAFAAARRLTREEGILSGESCGTALVATLRVARELSASAEGREAVMVVILPDGGRSYLSKLYDDEWMRANGLLGTATGRERILAVLRNGHGTDLPDVVLARTTDRVATAIDTLERYGISQMPVTERADDSIEGIVGSINERSLLERAYRDPGVVERTVGEVMDRPLPTIDADASMDQAFQLLSDGAPALVAVVDGRPAGVVTKLDLLEYLAHKVGARG
ncbi:MAG: cystathionine beta-synthase [Chloroflexi bacterium]|nr:cystathionine beta-synthase [Chloroflexota bacterium]HEV8053666.1 cystathionine beta-synthase [Candidatus Limnocylindrales bacterium]